MSNAAHPFGQSREIEIGYARLRASRNTYVGELGWEHYIPAEQVLDVYEQLDAEGVKWAQEILTKSPLAIRCLKSAFNAELDGQAGIQELSGNATLLYYLSEEGDEGRAAWNEKRAPNFRKFPWLP